jgi:tetratricopeptide (TPR) repeat protein
MLDKASIVKEAQKYLSKGQIDKAIVEWEKLVNAYPEGNTFNFIGDLYLRKGDKASALNTFHKAAKAFRDEGFSLKALAIYKKILNLNPFDADALYSLGELNEEKSIITDAIKYYLAAADILSKENRKDELLKVYDRILQLAPTNIGLRIRISELFSKEGFVQEASKEYYQIGLLYEEQNDIDKAQEFLLKSIEIQPNNKEALLALSRIAQNRGNLEQAANYLEIAVERTGEDSELLLRKAQLLVETNSLEEALNSVSRALELDPSNLDARMLLADLYHKKGDMDRAWQEYSTALDSIITAERFDEAINILNTFKDFDPVESRKKLVSLYTQTGNEESAFNELMELAGIYEEKNMQQELLECLKEASAIQPYNTELKQRIEDIEKQMAPAAPEVPPEVPPEMPPEVPPEVPPEMPPEEMVIEPTAVPREKTVEEALTEADILLRYGLHTEARNLLESLKVRAPENIDVHLKLKSLYIDIDEKEQAVTECLILAELYSRAGDEQTKKAFLKEAYDINPEDPRLAARLEEIKEAIPTMEIPQPEPTEAVLEAPAEGVPEEQPPAVEERVPEEPQPPAPEEAPAQPVEERPEEQPPSEELPEEPEPLSLDELLPPEAETVEAQEIKEPTLESDVLEVFEEFKKGLEKEIEAEDSETHYNLGIAYKEMGLLDDAINSFQTAKHDPKLFVQSTTLLGACYMQKGLYDLAIESFSSALMKIDPKDESAWSVKYELAEAYEKKGNIKEALKLYTEVYGWNSKFREVSEKINSLKKSEEAQRIQKERKSRVSYL